HCAGDPDRVLRLEGGDEGADVRASHGELGRSRRVRAQEALGEADTADVDARRARGEAGLSDDELGRAAADVDDQGALDLAPAHRYAAVGERGLSGAAQQRRREPVAPLALSEEGLAVLGVADSARGDRESSRRTGSFELTPILGEAVPHAGDRNRQQPTTLVD